nr:porin family protein [Hymenobacter terricola]
MAGAGFATLGTGDGDGQHRATAQGRAGYQASLFYQFRLNNRWAVVPALQVSRQHVDLTAETYGISDGGYLGIYRLGLTYLTVPLRVRATLGKFYLEAGPQLGLLVGARETGTEYGSTYVGGYQREFDRLATDRYRRFDAGPAAGAGLQLPAGFGLAVQAYAGLLSITHVPQSTSYAGSLYNRVVQAALTYKLPARR